MNESKESPEQALPELAEHQRLVAALQESEERYQYLITSITDYVYTAKVEGGEVVATLHGPGCIAVTGYTPREYEADPNLWYRMIYEPDREAAIQQAAKVLTGETTEPLEHRLIHKDGSLRWVRNTPVLHYNEQGQLIAYQGLIADITARKQAEIECKRLLRAEHEQRLLAETLGEVFLALTSRISSQEVLDEILNQAQRLVTYSAANIVLLEGDSLRTVRGRGYSRFGSQAKLTNLEQLLNNYPLDAEVIQLRKPVIVPDTTQNPRWTTITETAWIRSFLAVPICLHERVLGLLRLDSDTVCTFSPQDIERLRPLADAAAIALENAHLYDERKKETDALAESEARLLAEMQSVLAINRALVSEINLDKLLRFIMIQAEHLMNADGTAVLLLSEDGQHLEVAIPGETKLPLKPGAKLPVQGSIAGLALDTQRVQISNQVEDDDCTTLVQALLYPTEVQSLLYVPLIVQGEKLGVLLIWSKRVQNFVASDSHLMSLFADQAALALYNARLHAKNRQLAIEQERHRLARDLHDSVTQSLYSMRLAARTALKLLDHKVDSRIREAINHIQQLSRVALVDMRKHLYELNSSDRRIDSLVNTLTQHCHMLRNQYALTITCATGPEPPLQEHQREALYYIAQEALWNVIKHAQATQVNLELNQVDNQLVLSIADNGIGFDPLTVHTETMGLKNIKERVKLLPGNLDLQSRPGQGTHLTVYCPLSPLQ